MPSGKVFIPYLWDSLSEPFGQHVEDLEKFASLRISPASFEGQY